MITTKNVRLVMFYVGAMLVLLSALLLSGSVPARAQSQGAGKIAFDSDRDNGNSDIYVMNADGSGVTRLTTDPDYDSNPVWSPGNSKIAFGRSSTSGDNSDIYVMNADGSNQINLTNNSPGTQEYNPTWSADGSKIAFSVTSSDSAIHGSNIYVMNADGSNQTNLTNSTDINYYPTWSPDGKKIAFISSREKASTGSSTEVYVMNADGSGVTRLTNNTKIDFGPTWSPNGGKIAFARVTDFNFKTTEIYVMNADGSGETRLTNDSFDDGSPTWSPDGSRIAFQTERDGNNEIYVMNADGSNQTNITNNSGRNYDPSWSNASVIVTPTPVATATTAATATAAASSTSLPTPLPLPGTGSTTFPETGKVVTGIFLDYWKNNGGLPQQGFPISNVMSEKSDLNGQIYTVQYFERAVFEYHPEQTDPKYKVLLSQLGTFQYQKKYGAAGAPEQKASTSNPLKFAETGKTMGGKFRAYWETHGGLSQQGFPISDEFQEVSPLDGKTYTVQYFERAVFEMHPENAGTPYEVLLSQLGTFQYKAKYGGGSSSATQR